MGCDPNTLTNSARFFYGDGASRSGYRDAPWAVPGNASQQMYFRGARSFDAGIDLLLKLGMSEAELIVFSGGSAGGLTVFLHLDHVAQRMRTEAPRARVVGEPVCGFFIDSGNDGYAPANQTYPLQMAYVYAMQNTSGSLSPECQAHYGPDEAWKCIMAPYAAPFISTPWFALRECAVGAALQQRSTHPPLSTAPNPQRTAPSPQSRGLTTGNFLRSSSCRACRRRATLRPSSPTRAGPPTRRTLRRTGPAS